MSWRIVTITSRAKLDYKMDYLVVRTEEKINRIHLSEISLLLIESTAVSLTAYLLCELARHKIKVIFCDEKRNPFGELTQYYGSHDTSLRIRTQIAWQPEIKAFVWSEIVRAKIIGQISVLPKERTDAINLLQSYIPEIEPGDQTNREAHAAKVYFNALFGMTFSRNAEDVTNAALNYGYGILLSAFNREVAACGYLTQIGIFHDSMFNPFNLSCDLMEPFRPFVDQIVYEKQFHELEHEQKILLVQQLNREIVIDEKRHYLNNAIKLYCRSVFEALNEKDLSKIKFPQYELSIYENYGDV